jgi:hypothetical protein
MPELFDGLWRSCLHGMNPPPIQASKQGFKLGVAQPHQAILGAGQSERLLFQPFVRQHDIAPVPVDQLQPACLA